MTYRSLSILFACFQGGVCSVGGVEKRYDLMMGKIIHVFIHDEILEPVFS